MSSNADIFFSAKEETFFMKGVYSLVRDRNKKFF